MGEVITWLGKLRVQIHSHILVDTNQIIPINVKGTKQGVS